MVWNARILYQGLQWIHFRICRKKIKTAGAELKPRCALPTIFIFPSVIKNLRSGRQTGVYRNFTRLVKFPNVNPALKNFSALIFQPYGKNRGEIFGGLGTSLNRVVISIKANSDTPDHPPLIADCRLTEKKKLRLSGHKKTKFSAENSV